MKTTPRSKRNKSGPDPQKIRIEFHDEQAKAVSVAGTFNEWSATATLMIALAGGRWVKELVLPPGRYEYRLVVDGQWRTDPAASECVPNGLGDCNCVLVVAPGHGQPGD
jgi:1,4-alpha-glucan branching enzyme